MFADVTEFKLINANIPDICLTQLTTLQNYLRTIHKRNELTIPFTVKLSHNLLDQLVHMVCLKHIKPLTRYHLSVLL